jgi:hypothetical protein
MVTWIYSVDDCGVASDFINLPHPFYEVVEVHTVSPVCTSTSNIWLRLSHLKQFIHLISSGGCQPQE